MTYSLNLKKCLTCSLGLILLSTTLSFGSTPSGSKEKEETAHSPLLTKIQKDLRSHQKRSFRALLTSWEKKYGTQAINPLMSIASESTQPDRDRYIALMGATKIGGKALAPRVARFLEDRSWLMRSASLKALRVLKDRRYGKKTLTLLKDPSLIVRNEAVKTIGKLRPRGSVRALIRTLHDPKNYHKGKAQWVPQRALKTLVYLRPKPKAAYYLRPLLYKKKDAQFLKQVVMTIEKISSIQSPKDLKFQDRVNFWKKSLQMKPS